jgi:hypothetical protein
MIKSATMINSNPLHCLPSSAELPDSDDLPVDNELQILIPRREWLYWYDKDGNRYQTPEEVALASQQQLQDLIARLQQRGIDPNTL